jgi:glycosyltransferase involved in cell wall biosynthesis
MRISIVICNYNYEAFVDAAIRSAIEQDHPDVEVVVVDDGSTDGSRAVIERWGGAVRRIFKANGGQVSAYNAGFAEATGDVVIFLDSDDVLDRGACRRIELAFTPDVVKVHYRLRLIDASGAPVSGVIPSRLAEGDLADRLIEQAELYDSAPGSGNAYRTSALARLMPIVEDAHDRHGADFFTIYAISLLGRVAAAGQAPLGSYRVHRSSVASGLVFGNSSHDLEEPNRVYHRYDRMRGWVVDRLGETYRLPPAAPNFSVEKQRYATTIFGASGYLAGLRVGAPLLAQKVLPAAAHLRTSAPRRAALMAWATAVLLLPRAAGLPVARFVCNPAARRFA